MSLFIQVDSATVTFDGVQPLEALKDVSISIEKGEWVNIFGPSGSGKTTFLNVISGSIPLASGMVKVDGQNLSELKGTKLQEYRRNFIGYIFQDFRLFDQFTVLENVMLPQMPYKPKKEIEERAKTILDDLNLLHRQNALPSELSGGEKQRTAIARAILNNPKILLCDEPTGNLDTENRDNIMQIFKKINNAGVTILLVTHDYELVKWGTKQLVIRDGRLMDSLPALT